MDNYLSSFEKQVSTGSENYKAIDMTNSVNISKVNTSNKYYDKDQLSLGVTKTDMDKPNPSGVKVRKLRLYKQQWIKT